MDDRQAKPEVPPGAVDERVLAAWRVWLSALATDAEAALAAALAYEALDGSGRALWLDALDQDAPNVDVPRVAIYAPLLWVEDEPERRARIEAAVGDDIRPPTPRIGSRALRGLTEDGDRIVALVLPLYLDFVQVLACRFRASDGFVWVRHDPIVRNANAPQQDAEMEGALLEQTPLTPVIEELAHAVLAHRRTGRELPDALRGFVDLFDTSFDGS